MPAENITILEELHQPGGAFDGDGDTEKGFIARGGREMEQHFECFWDVMKDIPALEMPEPYSVMDEFRIVNENDPNVNHCRIINNQGQKRSAYKMGINKKGQLAVLKLLLAKESDTYYKSIEDWFDEDFLHSTFYTLWKTMFAFEQWQSLTEFKRYMHRFLHLLPGFSDLSCLRFSRYNQYDSFVVPLMKWLTERGVKFQYDTLVYDVDLEITAHRKVARGILWRDKEGGEHRIDMTPKDLVFVTDRVHRLRRHGPPRPLQQGRGRRLGAVAQPGPSFRRVRSSRRLLQRRRQDGVAVDQLQLHR